MSEADVIKKWNEKGKAYATLDRNLRGQNKVIMAKGHDVVMTTPTRPITDLYLDEIWERHPKPDWARE